LQDVGALNLTTSFGGKAHMNFLARDEANSLEKKLRRQIADQPRPKLVLYYRGGASRDYSHAANAITASRSDCGKRL
jgi:hypothetical protein